MNAFYPIFGKMIKELGFKQRTRSKFFLEKEDMIAYFSAECPSSWIYVQFGIIPKYLPPGPGILYYTYGNRMGSMYPDLHNLKKEDSEEKMRLWCTNAKRYILRDLMPLIESISTVSSIRQYILKLKDEKRMMRYRGTTDIYRIPIFCMDSHLQYLLIYSDLYLNHLTDAEKDASFYYFLLEITPIMPSLKEKLRKEIQQILDTARNPEKLQTLFDSWCAENRDYFIKQSKN